MKTYASLFTGGGLADTGAIAAGYTPIWGIEYIPEIADVARLNGLDVLTANILDCDPRKFDRPDLFHASPPCPNFSVAKQGGEETALDIALAKKVAEFITVLRPPSLTIENVQAYIKSKSYKIIMRAVEGLGYMYDAQILNSADFGVPQTRRRLFVRAVSGGMVPYLPAPVKWVGWYAAIADIIHTLPESKFADWQLARLPDFCESNFMINANRTSSAWIQESDIVGPCLPSPTVASDQVPARAFLLSGCGISAEQKITFMENEPSPTLTASEEKRPARAFLVDGKPLNFDGDLNIIDAPTPTPTLTASQDKHPFRAWLSQGRVVAMTPRALARFQSVPDSYILPERRTLAGRIIGNGVPSLLYEKVAGSFL